MKAKTKKLLLISLIATAGTLVFLVLLYFLIDNFFDGWFNSIMSTIVYGYRNDWYNFKGLLFFWLFVFIILPVLLCIILVSLLSERKARKEVARIIPSINAITQKSDELIVLPEEYKEAENQLNAIKNSAIKNERLAKEAEQRKNDLVVYLAHDLKTPLTSIVGYLTLLRDEPDISPEMRRKYTGISLEKALRLEELINEFFDITRFNLQDITLEKSRFDLSLMIRQITDEFYPSFMRKNVTCTLDADDRLIIEADSDKLSRVFDNLLKNALSYSDPDSPLLISVHRVYDNAVIQVTNHGADIPEHKLSMIFERFYRLDSARSANTGGAGLGLAIAKEITELHGGTITAESGNGLTSFIITLPV